jgi:hypothetical protein
MTVQKKGSVTMVSASDYDKSRFFRADDFEEPKTLRIKTVSEEALGQGADRKQKLVAWFHDEEKGLVVNKTNNRCIRGAYGDDTDGWTDKPIVLFAADTQLGPGVRVRIPPPRSPVSKGSIQHRSARPATKLVDDPDDDDDVGDKHHRASALLVRSARVELAHDDVEDDLDDELDKI